MEYLVHHGIKGQSWGVRNGPPYPLGVKIHRKVIAKAKEAGEKVKETTTKVKQSADNYRKNFDKKKAMKVGAIAAGAALAAVGGYYLYKSGALDSLVKNGKNFIGDVKLNDPISNLNSVSSASSSKKSSSLLSQLEGKTFDSSKLGKAYENIDKGMVESINKELRENGTMGGNCSSATAVYLMNEFFGTDFKTVPMESGIDATERYGAKIFEDLFKTGSIKEINPAGPGGDAPMGVRMGDRVFRMIPNGSSGYLHTYSERYGHHVVAYEKTKSGAISLVENKLGQVLSGDRLTRNLGQYGNCMRIMDCSNLELADGLTEEAIARYARSR